MVSKPTFVSTNWFLRSPFKVTGTPTTCKVQFDQFSARRQNHIVDVAATQENLKVAFKYKILKTIQIKKSYLYFMLNGWKLPSWGIWLQQMFRQAEQHQCLTSLLQKYQIFIFNSHLNRKARQSQLKKFTSNYDKTIQFQI